MNAVFTALVLLSLAAMAAMSPSEALPAMVSGVTGAVTLSLKLTAIYAVWLSVLRMMQETGLDKKLSRGLRPLIKRLFKGEKEETYDLIAVNLASDLLGMGGAATAAGIDAMRSMSDGSERASDNMLLLLVVNAVSVQLIPATVIALRAAGGSADASSVILPIFLSSLAATVVGVVLSKIFSGASRAK